MKLSTLTLNQVPESVAKPTYDRAGLKTRIIHLGLGAFHRAHQAVFTDELARNHGSDWGICAVNLMNDAAIVEQMRQQDCLYTVAEMAADAWNSRVIGSITEALHPALDGIATVLERMADPEVAIVSLTVTEKGYCHNPATGQLVPDHPLVRHDIENPDTPKSALGLIVAALKLRRDRGRLPFTVMSCDNMPHNGSVARNVVIGLAAKQDPALGDWIARHVRFPSTMVDRIVPAVTPEALATVNRHLAPIEDQVAVACEPFRQWVIEDSFVNGRPAWEKAGAELVADVLPYEKMKLRMLNGSHSFLAYLGYLAGYPHIGDCMGNPDFVQAARHLMLEEQAATLTMPGVDLAAYAGLLLDRYRNPALKHRTWQIAMDGTQKLPQRMLDSIRFHLERGTDYSCLALGVAAWMRYVGGVDEKGAPIEISDPLAPKLKQLVEGSAEGDARVAALLTLDGVFGSDLPADERFVRSVTTAYSDLLKHGAAKTVARLVSALAEKRSAAGAD